MNNYFLEVAYHLDRLSMVMMFLIAYIGICVLVFASSYMKGDSKYQSFFFRIILLILSVAIMVTSDQLWVLLGSLCLSNLILVTLMIHKSKWKAAKASGVIAGKNYLLSIFFMALSFTLFYLDTGQTKISVIIHHHSWGTDIALLLLLVSAMAQSAVWPFHKWLISSLNSPTPVSAIMHAGLINGGGFLLARFASVYSQSGILLNVIFILGMISALVGTLWKLMQSDIKRVLACSTMAQMGFMFAQCGLGLFPLAIAHLFWHGMYKAYSFLSSGAVAQEARLELFYPPKPLTFILALFSGFLGSLVFAYASQKSWVSGDSTLVLLMIVCLAGAQLSLSILRNLTFKNVVLATLVTIIAALLYAGSTQLIAWILAPMKLMYPQPLNIFHIVAIVVLTLAWISILFIRNPSGMRTPYLSWIIKFYVKVLNRSQPHPDTVTAHRNHYRY